MKKTSREINDALAKALESRINAENFDEQLMLYFEAKSVIESHARWLKTLRETCNALGNRLASWAQRAKTSAFNAESWHETANGMQGARELPDGTLARLTVSREKYARRNDGDEFSQAFLAGLPAGWTKEKTQLDMAALAKESDEALLAADIIRSNKSTWTRQQKGVAYDKID